MADRPRKVDWSSSALSALDEVLTYIADDSHDGVVRVLSATLRAAADLSTFAERGRVVPELADPTIREVFVFRYRLLYRVTEDVVTILAFLHGARDFSAWQKDQALGK